MTDDELARRVCAMLGLEFVTVLSDAVCVVVGGREHGYHRLHSWPDLSAAALRHVEEQGWTLADVVMNDENTRATAQLDHHGEDPFTEPSWDGPASESIYKALCAAACQTQDGLR